MSNNVRSSQDVTMDGTTTFSTAVAVPGGLTRALVSIPTVSSTTVNLQVSQDGGTTYYPLFTDVGATQGVAATTGQKAIGFTFYGSPTHARVKFGTKNTDARTINISFAGE